VYRCEQPALGRDAVVKVLRLRKTNAAQAERFLREAKLASRLDHPYPAHVYAFGVEDDGVRWIAMELVQGVSLREWLKARGPMPLALFVPYFELVAEVVHAAHLRGIVHRDLKPSNVMVIESGARWLPKLLDFGIARLFESSVRVRRGASRGRARQPRGCHDREAPARAADVPDAHRPRRGSSTSHAPGRGPGLDAVHVPGAVEGAVERRTRLQHPAPRSADPQREAGPGRTRRAREGGRSIVTRQAPRPPRRAERFENDFPILKRSLGSNRGQGCQYIYAILDDYPARARIVN